MWIPYKTNMAIYGSLFCDVWLCTARYITCLGIRDMEVGGGGYISFIIRFKTAPVFIVSHINTANTIQCSFFGGPTWYTVAQHQANIGSMSPAYTRRQKQAYCHFFPHAAAAPADVFVAITAGGRRNTVRSATCPQQTRNVDPMLG